LTAISRYILTLSCNPKAVDWPLAEAKSMRAEVERLVEEIKQSVGLLRRHL
jgi:hypothetical protein